VSFDGSANIDLAGVNTAGNQDTSGNAATATILATGRTINGVSFNGSANITTLTAGTGVAVSGTAVSIGQAVATSDSPTFANMTLSGTDSIKISSGTTAQRNGTPTAGMFRYNTTTGEFEGYTDEWGAIGGGGGSFTTDIFAGDGADTTFTVSSSVSNENNLMVFIDGVFQAQDSYSVSGTTLTFSTAPANGRVITVYHAKAVSIGTPSDNSVDTVQLVDGAVTSAKLDTNIAVAGTLGVTGDITGTLATAAQPNITSVGSLTALDVTGTATMDGLTVEGSSAVIASFARDGSDGDAIQIFNGGVGTTKVLGLGGVGNNGIITNQYGNIQLAPSGTTRATISSTGIDVTGTVTADGLTVDGTGTFSRSDNENLFIADTTNTTRSSFQVSNATTFFNGNIDTATHGNFVWRSSNAYTERLRIDSSGGFTTTPAAGGHAVFNEGGVDADFRVESDTNAHAFYVDGTNGNVGIGTNADYGDRLSVVPAATATTVAAAKQIQIGEASNNPSYRMQLGYYADPVNGYQSSIQSIAGGNPASLVLNGDGGNVLIGTTTSLGVGTTFTPQGSNGTLAVFNQNYGNGFASHQFRYNGTAVGSIVINTSSTAYNTSSDYRLKENVVTDWDATTRLKQLKPSRFNFIADADTTVDGFLAHEVQDIVPEAITGVKDEMQEEEYEVTPAVLDEDLNVVTEAVMGTREVPKYQGIDQSKLVPLLTKALQEALTKIEQLETRIETLENA
jgi:hypothetical protein